MTARKNFPEPRKRATRRTRREKRKRRAETTSRRGAKNLGVSGEDASAQLTSNQRQQRWTQSKVRARVGCVDVRGDASDEFAAQIASNAVCRHGLVCPTSELGPMRARPLSITMRYWFPRVKQTIARSYSLDCAPALTIFSYV